MGVCYWLVALTGLTFALLFGLLTSGVLNITNEAPKVEEKLWWRRGQLKQEVESVESFNIKIPDQKLTDLKNRLKISKIVSPLEDSKFEYGINLDYLKNKVLPYWRDKYDWRKWEKQLNSFNQFTTIINGLKVHFIHVKPDPAKYKSPKVLLMTHGWPGSLLEFYKLIPILTDPLSHGGVEGDALEIVAPHIPGYGWSQAAELKGFNLEAAAQVLVKLMTRLGFTNFYLHGGDWGALVHHVIAVHYPTRVQGIHTTMVMFPNNNLDYVMRLMVGSVSPRLVMDESDAGKVYPFFNKTLEILSELGYFTIQSTKPDTVGAALQDSPIGLAAYILEKFSTWTNMKNRQLPDGGLTNSFTLDELLTNVMIYWLTDSITSSQRFYKENLPLIDTYGRIPVTVPAGVACFPNELAALPKDWAKRYVFPNLVHYSDNEKGGHFPALEVPDILAKDIRRFVKKVEESRLYFAGHFSDSSKK